MLRGGDSIFFGGRRLNRVRGCLFFDWLNSGLCSELCTFELFGFVGKCKVLRVGVGEGVSGGG